jgi:hypothetical protein
MPVYVLRAGANTWRRKTRLTRLIGSTASSSRSKSMQASLRPSASADVEPLSASRLCAAPCRRAAMPVYVLRAGANTWRRKTRLTPRFTRLRQTHLVRQASDGTATRSDRSGRTKELAAQTRTLAARDRRLCAAPCRRAAMPVYVLRAGANTWRRKTPAMVQPRALIVRVGPKSLPHKLELCVPDWGLVGSDVPGPPCAQPTRPRCGARSKTVRSSVPKSRDAGRLELAK